MLTIIRMGNFGHLFSCKGERGFACGFSLITLFLSAVISDISRTNIIILRTGQVCTLSSRNSTKDA